MSRQGRCRECGDPIEFVGTEAGNWLPIDPWPQIGGNITLERRPEGLTAVVHGPRDAARLGRAWPMYMAHAATCRIRHPDRDPNAVPPPQPVQESLDLEEPSRG